MSHITIDEVRKHGNRYYKVIKVSDDEVVCHPRNGPTGRYSMNEKTIDLDVFSKYEVIKRPATYKPNKKSKLPDAEVLLDQERWTDDIALRHENKLLKNENSKLKRKLIGRKSGEQAIVRGIKQALDRNPIRMKLPPLPSKVSGNYEEIAVLHISDTQIGKITDSYSTAIAEQRLIELVQKTCKITDIRRAGGAAINEIRVYLGGDIIEGEDIFPHQAHLIDEGVFDQTVWSAPTILTKCILLLMSHFNLVRVVTVPGNHGRNGPRNTRSHPKTNWDDICYYSTKRILRGLEGKEIAEELETEDDESLSNEYPGLHNIDDRLEFEISDKFYAVDHVFDWGNLIVHGDQITGGFAGFPWYGTAKKAWGWIDSIPLPWDYMWFGHFHTYAGPVTLNHRIFLANGTTESDNEFAQANMAAAGFPCQRLCFFNEEYGLIADHQIFLSRSRKPSKTKALAWINSLDE